MRVMTNLLIDHHRRDLSAKRTAERLSMEVSSSGSTSDVRHADPADLAAAPRWDELVRNLTPQQRLVATLYYAHDLPVDTIASTTQLSTGTVKSTLSKARHNLQQILSKTHGGGDR
jgi:RNA polymerase sigma factor (sigma-70 family)